MVCLVAALVGCGAPAPSVDSAAPVSAPATEPTAVPESPTLPVSPRERERPPIDVLPSPVGAPVRCADDAVWVGTVLGRLVDQTGAPLADEGVGLCGAFCLGARTRADGKFTLRANACFPRTVAYPHGVGFDVRGLGFHADFTVDLNPGNGSDLDAVDLRVLSTPSMLESPSVQVPHEGDGPRSVTLPGGFALTVAPGSLTLPFGALERLSAAPVDRAHLPPFDAHGALPTTMFAVTPGDATFAAPAPLTLPNDQRLAPGEAVDIVMVGGPATAQLAPVGGLGVVDSGHVAADGLTVAADHGIAFLGWVGYRPRPQ